jgi:hypothetical protein
MRQYLSTAWVGLAQGVGPANKLHLMKGMN